MKLTLSPADRIGPSGPPGGRESRWASILVYGVVVPFTLAAVAASGWYVATGETPLDLLSGLGAAPRIDMVMPPRPGPEKPAASLLRPPATPEAAVKQAADQAAPAQPPAGRPEARKTETERTDPQKRGAAPAGPPPINLPTTAAPPPTTAPAPSTSAVQPQPPPAMAEPVIPPGGEPLAPPSFAQLPSREEKDIRPLPPGPLPELLRQGRNGALPVVAAGKESWKAYARPFTGDAKLPRIAIVVTGLGLSRDATNAAIAKLPPEVSLSFSPYASGLEAWIKKARAGGHEVLLDLPLEPPNFPLHDAGPLAVLSHHSPAEAIEHLETVLTKANSYVGVAAALRSPVAASEQWGPMLRDLKTRGLLFVGDGLVGVAETNMPPAASVTLVADETPFRIAIDARLTRLLMAAQRDGAALAYVSPRPVTFERILSWAATLSEKGALLAPASAVVRNAG